MTSPGCVFCSIVAGDVPADVVLETDALLAFLDQRPVFKGHVLLVPREHVVTLPELPADRHAVTVSSTASLLAAVPAGGVVTTTARVDRLGRTQAFLSGELRCGDRLVATGQVVKAVVPA